MRCVSAENLSCSARLALTLALCKTSFKRPLSFQTYNWKTLGPVAILLISVMPVVAKLLSPYNVPWCKAALAAAASPSVWNMRFPAVGHAKKGSLTSLGWSGEGVG